MLEFNFFVPNQYLLKLVGGIWLLSFSQIALTAVKQITEMYIFQSSHCTRVMIRSNHILKYKSFILTNPKRIVITIKDIHLNPILKKITRRINRNDLYIKSVCAKQYDLQTVRVIFELKQGVKSRLFALAPMSRFQNRLVLDLYSANTVKFKKSLMPFLKENYRQNKSKKVILQTSRYKLKTNKKNRRRRNHPFVIMLDPGHGGEDYGAVGKFFTREKDVTLQIVRRLKALIECENNMRVYTTRNKDVFIPLDVRVKKAQKQHADLFISIHTDAFKNRRSNGSSVFALSSKEINSVVAAPCYLATTQSNNTSFIKKSTTKSSDKHVNHTILNMMQSLTITNSLNFGRIVLRKLGDVNRLHKNKVEQASFAVLKAPNIPSILVETAFISNIKEEHKLRTASFQEKIAKSILAGIKIYFSTM